MTKLTPDFKSLWQCYVLLNAIFIPILGGLLYILGRLEYEAFTFIQTYVLFNIPLFALLFIGATQRLYRFDGYIVYSVLGARNKIKDEELKSVALRSYRGLYSWVELEYITRNKCIGSIQLIFFGRSSSYNFLKDIKKARIQL